GRVAPAPGVEREVHEREPPPRVGHEDRAVVPHPGVVDGDRQDLDAGPAVVAGLAGLGRVSDHDHGLEPRDSPRHRRVVALGVVEQLSPQLRPGAGRPFHQARLVGGPFGGHAETVLTGRAHRRLRSARARSPSTRRDPSAPTSPPGSPPPPPRPPPRPTPSPPPPPTTP